MAHILLLATGGTIASKAQKSGAGVTAQLAGNDLLAGVALPKDIQVTVQSFASLGSNAIQLSDVLTWARMIEAILDQYDGVVITHGTDTMEETAFALELLLAPQKPVILTGAQRHAGEADTDGPRNLRDAIVAAAEPDMAAAGVSILFEGDLHSAQFVRKTHTSRVDTFRSGDYGKLGSVDGGKVRLAMVPKRRVALGTRAAAAEVLLITAAMGMSADILAYALQSSAKGVILQGFGRGNFPIGWAEATEALVNAGKPVVITSRCSEGEVRPIYGNDSGGVTMASKGAWFAGELDAPKARLVLAFLLGAKPDLTEDEFNAYHS